MIVVDEKYCTKKESVRRYREFAQNSLVFLADGSFENGRSVGGYGFVSDGANPVCESGVDVAQSPVEMELQAIKHTLIYLNVNKNKIENAVIFNDCLCAISKIKSINFVQAEQGGGADSPAVSLRKPGADRAERSEILEEIAVLLRSLCHKNIGIYWIKKEILPLHEKVDSLSKAARMMQR